MVDPRVVFLTTAEVTQVHDQVVGVYRMAFTPPPYREDEAGVRAFGSSLQWHVKRVGFRFAAARAGEDDRIVGFAYGYTCASGQWWHDIVARALSQQNASEWMKDPFEVVELAVDPAWQGKGLGGRLHDALLADLPYRTALLSTMQAETNALHLYNKRGWVPLLSDFIFPGVSQPYIVMGLNLKNITTEPTENTE